MAFVVCRDFTQKRLAYYYSIFSQSVKAFFLLCQKSSMQRANKLIKKFFDVINNGAVTFSLGSKLSWLIHEQRNARFHSVVNPATKRRWQGFKHNVCSLVCVNSGKMYDNRFNKSIRLLCSVSLMTNAVCDYWSCALGTSQSRYRSSLPKTYTTLLSLRYWQPSLRAISISQRQNLL